MQYPLSFLTALFFQKKKGDKKGLWYSGLLTTCYQHVKIWMNWFYLVIWQGIIGPKSIHSLSTTRQMTIHRPDNRQCNQCTNRKGNATYTQFHILCLRGANLALNLTKSNNAFFVCMTNIFCNFWKNSKPLNPFYKQWLFLVSLPWLCLRCQKREKM